MEALVKALSGNVAQGGGDEDPAAPPGDVPQSRSGDTGTAPASLQQTVLFPEAIQTKHLPACCLEAENGALPFLLLDQLHSMKKNKSFSSPGQKDCSTNLKSVERPGSELKTHNYKNTKPFGRRWPCEMKWLPPFFLSL